MSEATQYMFGLDEVAELLIKKQGVNDGLWMISIEFGLAAASIPTGPDGKIVQPAAINFVQRIGIKKHEGVPTNLTLDAAEINPSPSKGSKKAGKKASRKGSKN